MDSGIFEYPTGTESDRFKLLGDATLRAAAEQNLEARHAETACLQVLTIAIAVTGFIFLRTDFIVDLSARWAFRFWLSLPPGFCLYATGVYYYFQCRHSASRFAATQDRLAELLKIRVEALPSLEAKHIVHLKPGAHNFHSYVPAMTAISGILITIINIIGLGTVQFGFVALSFLLVSVAIMAGIYVLLRISLGRPLST